MEDKIRGLLEGEFARLEPLSKSHLDDLSSQFEESLSQYYPHRFVTAADYFLNVTEKNCFGPCQVFAVIDKANSKAIGCTGLFSRDDHNRKIEIGGTWYGRAVQGTMINAEAKLLLFKFAFENLKCIRVELKTDSLNVRSQAAIEKLGAKREGLLRNHIIMPTGRFRHSVIYSVIVDEWPGVCETIRLRIANKASRHR